MIRRVHIMRNLHRVSLNLAQAPLKDPGGLELPAWRTLQRAASRLVGTLGLPCLAGPHGPRRESARHARVRSPRQPILIASVFLSGILTAQTPVEVVRVTSKAVERQVKL